MPKLIIANVDSEHQVADVSGYSRHEQSEIILCNQRMMWLADPGDVLVLPSAPTEQLKAYWAELNGCHADDLTVLTRKTGAPLAFLRQDILFAPEFIAACREVVAALPEGRKPSSVLAYFPDNYVAEFAEAIGVEVEDAFLQEGGATLLNEKTTFRKLAAGLGVSLPEGRVCENETDLKRAMRHFVSQGADFIVKLNRHSGGFGNLIVHGPRSGGKRLGSSTVLRYATAQDAEAILEIVASRIHEPAVVERYVDTDHVLYSEYLIDPQGRCFLLNDGTMNMEPLWVGFEIPGDYATHHRIRFLDESARLVRLAAQMGHRGRMNIDGLVAEGQIFVNEFNGRCGGCSHIFEIARRLFGTQVLHSKHIKTYNRGKLDEGCDLFAVLSDAGLLLRPGMATGAIPLTIEPALDQAFEYMVIAGCLAEARRISDEVLSLTAPRRLAA
jgi:hypothetical protein